VLVAYSDDDIKVYDVEAGRHTTLTNHPASDREPTWSGDGRNIAFVSDRNGAWDIYTMRADGRNVRQHTHSPRGKYLSAFSPNGRYVAYTLGEDRDGRSPIGLVDLRTGAETIIASGAGFLDTSVSWFPDNERILFIRRGKGWGIHQAPIDGSMNEELVLLEHDPFLGPDGRSIAYLRAPRGDLEIHVYDMVTGIRTPIPVALPPPLSPSAASWLGSRRMVVTDNAGDVHLVDIETGQYEPLPIRARWVRGFDTAHPWNVSARGRKPFTWGWLKSMGQVRP